jgi:protein-S-isoprenylcysteine O-methyltransferase Ste14
MRVGLLLGVALLLALGAGALIEQGPRQPKQLVGGGLVVVALPLLALARRQLGDAFAFTPQAKGLVTHGLYARIPHPMYVFLDLALLGGIILLGQTWILVAWVGLVLVQVLQARREARILERAFGAAYRDYRKQTWW